jgi:hypothetical protein
MRKVLSPLEEQIDNLLEEEKILASPFFHLHCSLQKRPTYKKTNRNRSKLRTSLCLDHNVLVWECGWQLYHHDGEDNIALTLKTRQDLLDRQRGTIPSS